MRVIPVSKPLFGRLTAIAVLAAAGIVGLAEPGRADQGGISFWLPGAFGSLAATPLVPGWSLASIYLRSDVSAGGGVAASRTLAFPNRTVPLNVSLQADLRARVDIGILSPSYVFASPVLGGQFAINVLGIYGRQQADITAVGTANLGQLGFATQRSIERSIDAWGDVFVQPTLRWNQGVHNYMVYAMANLPVGAYDSTRIVNLGLGHWSVDAGGGYTYFNPRSGFEFSAVTGFTYNFKNPALQYQNGVDWHLDAGASHFVTKQLHLGLVGYAYQQISADSGQNAKLGSFESRVFGAGPQVGFIFPVADMQGYLNLKIYKEFAAENRPEGWNAWVTFVISPEPPSSTTAAKPASQMAHK